MLHHLPYMVKTERGAISDHQINGFVLHKAAELPTTRCGPQHPYLHRQRVRKGKCAHTLKPTFSGQAGA